MVNTLIYTFVRHIISLMLVILTLLLFSTNAVADWVNRLTHSSLIASTQTSLHNQAAIPLNQGTVALFTTGLIFGSLSILAIYNLCLFFSQRDKTSWYFLSYIGCILIWFTTCMLDHNAGSNSWLLLIQYAAGWFLLCLTNERISNKSPLIYLYLSIFVALFAVIGADILFAIPTITYTVIVFGIVVISNLIYAGISWFNITTPTSPAIFCCVGFMLPVTYAICLSIFLLANEPLPHFIGLINAVMFAIQGVLFTVALNFKNKQNLHDEIHNMTDSLLRQVVKIETQNAQLDIARKAALKASNVKSRFIANISHEIRTPLNAIIGFSQALRYSKLAPDDTEQVNLINISAQNLHVLVNDVLDFSKIEAGKFRIHAQGYNPQFLFEELVEINAKSAHLKDLDFYFSIDNLPSLLKGDEVRIKQVMTNLLGNACKFTDTGAITLTVTGHPQADKTIELHIQVQDTGVGISEKNTNKLFLPFSQVDDDIDRGYQGSGLGLAISRDIMHMMKGSITVDSHSGQGSTFTVKFSQQVLSSTGIYDKNAPEQSEQVLLIDLDAKRRHYTNLLLQQAGMDTTEISSAQDLEQLATLSSSSFFSYCFVTLDQDPVEQLSHYLTFLNNMHITRVVFLYAGKQPVADFNQFNNMVVQPISLPLTHSKVTQLLEQPLAKKLSPIQNALQQLPALSILAVDDMPINLKLLSTFLINSPITLRTANSGQLAIELCLEQEFDIVLMDIQMPVMDGVNAMRAIRKTPLNIGTPIIALTAHASNNDKDLYLSEGFDDFLPKPIDLQQLISLIDTWCKVPAILLPISPPSESVRDAVPASLANPVATFDWALATYKAHGDEAAAKALLVDFIAELPSIISGMLESVANNKINTLFAEVHKLHGACSYTGVPQLQHICATIEAHSKIDPELDLDYHLNRLVDEADRVIDQVNEFLSPPT